MRFILHELSPGGPAEPHEVECQPPVCGSAWWFMDLERHDIRGSGTPDDVAVGIHREDMGAIHFRLESPAHHRVREYRLCLPAGATFE